MAGSKVNQKFVVLLVTAIVGTVSVAGAAGWFFWVQGGPRNIGRGDASMALGDQKLAAGDPSGANVEYKRAGEYYSKAVNHDPTKVDWFHKWLGALGKWVPANETEFRTAYFTHYLNALRQLATLGSKDAKAQEVYVGELFKQVRVSPSRDVFEQIVREIDSRLPGLDTGDPSTKRLLAYRGLSRLELGALTAVPEEDRKKGLDDLQAAGADDVEAGLGVVRWHLLESDLKSRDRRDAEADALRAKAGELLDQFLKQHPDNPEGLMLAMSMNNDNQMRKAVTTDDRLKLLKTIRPAAMATLNKLTQAKAEEIRPVTVGRMLSQVQPYVGKDGYDQTLSIIDKGLSAHPGDPQLLMYRGRVLDMQHKYKEAIDEFQKVAALPNLPVGFDGLLIPSFRQQAIGYQIDECLDQVRDAKDDADRAASLAAAKQYLEKLRGVTEANNNGALMLREAKIAAAEKRFDRAVALLSDLRHQRASENDPEVLLAMADALERSNVPGDALEIYENLLKGGYASPLVMYRAGILHLQMEHYDRSLELFKQVQMLLPDEPTIKSLIAQAQDRVRASRQADSDKTTPAESIQDPVLRDLLQYRRLLQDNRQPEALALLDTLYKAHPSDGRVIEQKIQQSLAADDRSGAMEVVDKALQSDPDNERWKQAKVIIGIPDPLQAELKVIDMVNASPIEKLVRIYGAYMRHDQQDKADATLADAVKLDPNNPQVLELQFLQALTRLAKARQASDAGAEKQALDDAQALVTKAGDANADQLSGMMFRARLLIARERFRDAAQVLRQAVDKIPNNPVAWRLLGSSLIECGQTNEGLEAFQHAYKERPMDLEIGKAYTRALMRANRGADALAVINPRSGVLRYGEDAESLNLWLDLEALHGTPPEGGRPLAIKARQGLMSRAPDDMINAYALARLLIHEERWDEATATIEKIKANPKSNPLAWTRLMADNAMARGKPDQAKQAYLDHIKEAGEKATAFDHLAYADWLMNNNFLDDALAEMKAAQPMQSKQHEADRELADFMFNAATHAREAADRATALATAAAKADDSKTRDEKTEEAKTLNARADDQLRQAAESYKAILADGKDSSAGMVMKRLAETYIRLRQYDDADKAVNQLVADAPPQSQMNDDEQVLLLRGSILEHRNDPRGARKLYDKAIDLYPGNVNPWMARAMLNMNDETLTQDVIADVTHITQLQPGNQTAWNILFHLYDKRGQTDTAFAQLNKAVDANPSDFELGVTLVKHLDAVGRHDEALAQQIRLANARKNDPQATAMAAQMSMTRGRYQDAANFFQRLLQLPGMDTQSNKAGLLDALLDCTSPMPNPQQVGELLREVDKIEHPTPKAMMLRARAEAFLGDYDKSLSIAREAYKAVGDNSKDINEWFVVCRDMFLFFSKKDGKYYREVPGGTALAVRDVFTKVGDARPTPPIMVILQAPYKRAAGASYDDLNKELDALADKVKNDPYAQVELLRVRNAFLYNQGKFEDLVKVATEALKIQPKDLEFNNNLAYTLSHHLNRPQEALPYAQTAADIKPDNSAIQDTLGQVYLQLNKLPEAEKALTNAVNFAQTPDEIVPANIHMGTLKAMQNDTVQANRCLDRAKSAAANLTPEMKAIMQPDIDGLSAKLK